MRHVRTRGFTVAVVIIPWHNFLNQSSARVELMLINRTDYSLSEVLILTSINPKYDEILFAKLRIQYLFSMYIKLI